MFDDLDSQATVSLLRYVMVYLTVTPAILKAIEYLEGYGESVYWNEGKEHPSQTCPSIGDPISHVKILNVSTGVRELAGRQRSDSSQYVPLHRVDDLLRGSRVYIKPSKPKTKPVCRKLQNYTMYD